MRNTLLVIIAALVLIVGTFMGVAAMFLLPIVGFIIVLGIVLKVLARKAEHKPPVA